MLLSQYSEKWAGDTLDESMYVSLLLKFVIV